MKNYIFKKLLLIFVGVFLTSNLFAQKTAVYTDKHADFKMGLELYDKAQFASAQQKFNAIIEKISDSKDEIRISSEYYAAICALELFNKDAEFLLRKFVTDHPDDTRSKTAFFYLGRHYYRDKKWKKAIEWFVLVKPRDLDKPERYEFWFKYGYSLFMIEKYDEAKLKFYEVKDSDTEYAIPATYYYSHIAYREGNFQVALDGFNKIKHDENFRKVVPYYITQIYYRQKKYDDVIDYGTAVFDSVAESRKVEFSKIIGDSYYRKQRYAEAIPFFEYHAASTRLNDLDKFQMGYSYYKVEQYPKAISSFNKISNANDSISQFAYYHLADCYLNTGDRANAKLAFKAAYQYNVDMKVKEEAHYNYIKILYQEGVMFSLDEINSSISEFKVSFPKSIYTNEIEEYLVDVYLSSKNYKQAIDKINTIAEKTFRLKTAYQVAAYNYAVQLYSNADFNQATKYFKEVKTYPIDPKLNAYSLYWLAECYYNTDDLTSAINYYNAFKVEAGAFVSNYNLLVDYNLGYCYFKKANYENAIIHFRNFVSQDVTDKELLYDAYIKLGDAYFLIKNDTEAGQYYAKSTELMPNRSDYALYQQARSYGLGTNPDYYKRAQSLETLVDKFTTSSYYATSLYELGEVYLNHLSNTTKSLYYFNRFISEFPSNSRVSTAMINIGKIYLNNKDYADAEKIFTEVVQKYPNSDQKEVAIKLMKSVYEQQGNLAGYTAWLNRNNINYSQRELDSSFYAVALEAYEVEDSKRDCNKVIKLFTDYLQNVTSPEHYTEANYYMAYCYDYQKDYANAVKHYGNVIKVPNNKFLEEALYRSSQINFYALKDYQAALSNFASLEKITSKNEYRRASIVGQMYCFDELKNIEFSAQYAERVYQLGDADNTLKLDAFYIHAKANFVLNNFAKAEPSFKRVTELTTSIRSAEALYHLALIKHLQKDFVACESAAYKVVHQKPSYDYWIAKAIILLSDNFLAQGDLFNAKYSLQSVIDNYKGDQAVIDEAKAKMERIKEMEVEAQRKQEEKKEEDTMMNFMFQNSSDLNLFNDEK
jgi:tetratricopeptide (TPR) repeat protein